MRAWSDSKSSILARISKADGSMSTVTFPLSPPVPESEEGLETGAAGAASRLPAGSDADDANDECGSEW